MFTFLNTVILSALALSLIPILIHLLNRKKSKLVLFSTLVFLKELQKNKMKKIKVRQILLLALRTLILLLAVLAFARPVSKTENRGPVEAHSKTSVVIIIDNSIGTSYVSEKGMIFDVIKNKVDQILNCLKEGDEAAILTGHLASDNQNASFSQNFVELKALAKSQFYMYSKFDINEALYQANKKFESSKNINKEIYVLTTFQASNFSDEKINVQKDIKLVFVDCSSEDYHNIGIQNVQVMSKIVEKTKPFDIRVTVRNYSRNSVQDVLLSAYLDGRRVGQSSLTINGDDESILDMKIVPTRSGFLQGSIEIDDDQLAADNKRFFHVFIPEQVRILLVGNKSQDTEFIKLALNPTARNSSAMQVKTVNTLQWPVENLNDYDVVIMSNAPRLNEESVRRLNGFLSSNKGLIIIPGSDTDISNYNSWLSKFGFGRIINASDVSSSVNAYIKFGQLDFSHPIIRGMFDQSKTTEKTVESPNFTKFLSFDNTTTSHTLISYSNNQPFMEESAVRKTNALLFTSSVDLSWSDWPVKGIFVPLMNRSVNYLISKSSENDQNFHSGDYLELHLYDIHTDGLALIDPDGVELRPNIKQLGDGLILNVPFLEHPGTYKIVENGVIKTMFDVNISPTQLDLRKLKRNKLAELLPSIRFETVSEGENIEDVILQSRYGIELWKWFVFGILTLLVVEVLISQRDRF